MPDGRINPDVFARRVAEQSISGTSMVVTVFGDTVFPHGGWIGIASLVKALAPLGFGERLVRTATYRLSQQDWLKLDRVGRRSYYCQTDQGQAHSTRAAKRIYSTGHRDWDGCWTLVLPVGDPLGMREKFVRSLSWQGFNPLGGGVYARPSAERSDLDETIGELGLDGAVVVLTASTQEPHSLHALRDLAQRKWKLDELHELYDEFLDFYRPLTRGLAPEFVTPQESFWLRTMLIHDYRRILLRDPEFPDAVLPTGWVGDSAYELVKHTYQAIAPASAQYIQAEFENANGPLPPPSRSFYRRFQTPARAEEA